MGNQRIIGIPSLTSPLPVRGGIEVGCHYSNCPLPYKQLRQRLMCQSCVPRGIWTVGLHSHLSAFECLQGNACALLLLYSRCVSLRPLAVCWANIINTLK